MSGEYPAFKWHPETGECQRFDHAEAVPVGWLDMHPSNLPPAVAADPKPAEPTMTRAEMKAALDAGGISYAKNATPSALYALLVASLKDHLTAAAVEFDPEADAPALLALVKAQSPAE